MMSRKHTQETKDKISKAHKGKKLSEDVKKKISEALRGRKPWNTGKHLSDETKRRMSKTRRRIGQKPPSRKGMHLSEETCRKISEGNKGKSSWIKGKHHSKETRKKISKSLKGHPNFLKRHTEETKKRISKSRRGIKFSEEARKKISETRRRLGLANGKNNPMYGKHHSKEIRRKLSELQKRRIGEKSPAWKGGISGINILIRGNTKMTEWRLNVFKRDKYTCQVCGDKIGGNLEAHHIIPVSQIIKNCNIKTMYDAFKCEELWDVNNGITLCKKCHHKVHKGEIKL